MYKTLLFFFFISSIALITLIMIQNGKSVDIGGSFKTNTAGTFFSLSSSGNSITRITAILAILFFISSLALSNLNNNKISEKNKWNNLSVLESPKKHRSVISDKKTNDIPK